MSILFLLIFYTVEHMLKVVKKYFVYIVIFLVVVIFGVSLYGSRRREGFTIPDTTQFEVFNSNAMTAKPLTGSEISTIMIELVNNVSAHDKKLTALDPKFPANDLSMDPDPEKRSANITKILGVIHRHDQEIVKMFPSYVPSPDLAGLIDGTLLNDKKIKLTNLSQHPFSPRDCSLDLMKEDLAGLQAKLAARPPAASSSTPDTVTEVLKSQISMKTQDMTDLQNNLNDPNFTKCRPPLTVKDADSIYVGYQLKHMTSIVMLQDTAINKIHSTMTSEIVNSWTRPELDENETDVHL